MSSRSAMITPPTIMIGEETAMVQAISTSICTCCTSLVLRVISDGAPKCWTSLVETSHPVEEGRTDVAPDAHRRTRAEPHGDHRAHDLDQRDGEHERAGAHDVARVAGDDAVVDDVVVSDGR